VERDWAKGFGWEERELWNSWNLALMSSETVRILIIKLIKRFYKGKIGYNKD
jgi:hypothetical protein